MGWNGGSAFYTVSSDSGWGAANSLVHTCDASYFRVATEDNSSNCLLQHQLRDTENQLWARCFFIPMENPNSTALWMEVIGGVSGGEILWVQTLHKLCMAGEAEYREEGECQESLLGLHREKNLWAASSSSKWTEHIWWQWQYQK